MPKTQQKDDTLRFQSIHHSTFSPAVLPRLISHFLPTRLLNPTAPQWIILSVVALTHPECSLIRPPLPQLSVVPSVIAIPMTLRPRRVLHPLRPICRRPHYIATSQAPQGHQQHTYMSPIRLSADLSTFSARLRSILRPSRIRKTTLHHL